MIWVNTSWYSQRSRREKFSFSKLNFLWFADLQISGSNSSAVHQSAESGCDICCQGNSTEISRMVASKGLPQGYIIVLPGYIYHRIMRIWHGSTRIYHCIIMIYHGVTRIYQGFARLYPVSKGLPGNYHGISRINTARKRLPGLNYINVENWTQAMLKHVHKIFQYDTLLNAGSD